jgi:hypothetical protein
MCREAILRAINPSSVQPVLPPLSESAAARPPSFFHAVMLVVVSRCSTLFFSHQRRRGAGKSTPKGEGEVAAVGMKEKKGKEGWKRCRFVAWGEVVK